MIDTRISNARSQLMGLATDILDDRTSIETALNILHEYTDEQPQLDETTNIRIMRAIQALSSALKRTGQASGLVQEAFANLRQIEVKEMGLKVVT